MTRRSEEKATSRSGEGFAAEIFGSQQDTDFLGTVLMSRGLNPKPDELHMSRVKRG